MPEPNCIITATFVPPDTFTYVLTHCSPGWQVSSNGTIQPPSRSRVIKIKMSDSTQIMGLQLALAKTTLLTDPPTDPFYNDTGGQATASLDATANTLTLDATDQAADQEIWYRLGVMYAGSPVWDDPRIYNDPDQ